MESKENLNSDAVEDIELRMMQYFLLSQKMK